MEENKTIESPLENGLQEEESSFDIKTIFTLLVLNWQWFLVSLIIFIAGAYLYLRYQPAVYEVSAKMLIKDETNNRRSNGQMLANMQDLGFITNSAGIDNEIEILKSRILALEVVNTALKAVLLTHWYIRTSLSTWTCRLTIWMILTTH